MPAKPSTSRRRTIKCKCAGLIRGREWRRLGAARRAYRNGVSRWIATRRARSTIGVEKGGQNAAYGRKWMFGANVPGPSRRNPRLIDSEPMPAPDLRCSFCGKGRGEVEAMVAGPTPAIVICDECVALCARIISEQRQPGEPAKH